MAKKRYDNNNFRAHKWLKDNFGSADRCEDRECPKKSKTFDWALKREKQYESKRENFLMLCRWCHSRYDRVHEKNRVHMMERKVRVGYINSLETRRKIGDKMRGRKVLREVVERTLLTRKLIPYKHGEVAHKRMKTNAKTRRKCVDCGRFLSKNPEVNCSLCPNQQRE